MEWVTLVVGFVVGSGIAGVVMWLLASVRVRSALEPAMRELEARARAAESAGAARAEELQRSADAQRALVDAARDRLGETFRALAAEALERNSDELRRRATESIVSPVRESLDRVDREIRALEQQRQVAYGRLSEQVTRLATTHENLRAETGSLVKALRTPAVRGRWGEIQLRRVVELAGMVEHCDFLEQVTVTGPDGRLRPDLVVRLPGGRSLVVDAKTPLSAYLDAIEAPSEEVRAARLRDHATQVRAHVQKLAAKAYWQQFASAPDYVILFLPGDGFYGAALEKTPTLLEDAVAQKVIIATPTTLIALLQAVHFGWRQERLAENAQRISAQGRVMHERVATLVEHLNRLGTSLGRSVESFNDAVASFESRVLPAARKLEELGAGSRKSLPELPQVGGGARVVSPAADTALTASELDA